jgi:alkylation response protein AidB-like acyl-CoA dehydrogenase
VFLDDVWAGPDAVLGGVGNGWAVIRKALAHERVGIARYARCERLLSELGRDLGEVPERLRSQWMRALIAARVARLLAYRAVRAQENGAPPDVAASAARIAVTQCDQQVGELLFQALEDGSLEAGADAPLHGAVEDHWRYAKAATVASGTIEVQRMIVAKALMGGRS